MSITPERIELRELEQEMRTSYLDYAMSVIVGRALPDVRDGLKPVHRRVLYGMNEMGLQPNRRYVKCAKVTGEVMGNYHPHGDSAIYDTLVRMGQEFSMRHMLVDPQGNFGSIDDDPPAAMRYTECRLSRIATEMLRDLDQDTVDFQQNYDGSTNEPSVLPARFPNLLVNGASGIAVGMATNIPPHNLRETIDATIAYMDDPAIEVEALMQHMKGPDFPTAGVILGMSGIRDAYRDGPRPRPRPGPRPHRAAARRPRGHRRHRAALPGQEGRPDRRHRPHRRAGQGQDHPRGRRHRGQLERRGDAHRHPPQARRAAQGRPQQALQAHADADDVRRQHGRARRRRPQDARACARSSAPTSTTSARSSSAGSSSSCARRRPASTSSTAC